MRWFFVMGLVACLTTPARADTPLRVARSDQRMRVDGSLREWRGARFVELGSGQGSLAYALAHRDGGLYVAARVRDDAIVRGRGLGKGQDALVLTFAMPTRKGGWAGTEVWLHPGVPGRSASAAGVASVGSKPRPASGVKVVEGPLESGQGVVIEAFVPWSALREADLWQMGRASLRYLDASRPGAARPTVDTAPGRRLGELPRLVSGEGETDALRQFLKSQGLEGAEPSHDLKGQVFADAVAERVSVVKGFVVLSGPSVGAGQGFAFARLPLGAGGRVEGAGLNDLTGDGRGELTLTMLQKSPEGERDVWGVVRFEAGRPQLVWGVEIAKRWGRAAISAGLHVQPGRGDARPSVVVQRGEAKGTDGSDYREARATDVQPILLPWEPVRRRIYRFEGGDFAMIDEVRDPEVEVPATNTATTTATAPATTSATAPATATATATGAGGLAAIRRALGLAGTAKPDRTLHANVAGDRRPETVYGFGPQLALLGPGIGEGQGYFVYAIPLRPDDALLSVEAHDVTGDGHAELLVRVRQALGPDVHREVLLVLRVQARGVEQALAVEVARSRGAARIDNQVTASGGALRIAAGRARGWTAQSYPFPDEPVGGVERLRLPWKDTRPVRYRLVQGKLQP